ncbi:MAG: site-specific integrase [Chloroflexi bacterium]|nr:site-specific integrase [Chloroflexota bacterium]
MLGHFQECLGDSRPSPELATSFLAQFASHKTTTLYRYHSIINGFMTWYGEPLSTRIKVPQTLPEYIEESDVEKLKTALASSRTHKGVIERNLLMVDLMSNTGMRRGEVANLTAGDVDLKRQLLVVRQGKGQKDREIEVNPPMMERLREFMKNKDSSESVFGLFPESISDIIKRAAKKAGVGLHAHSLRHYFGNRLVDRGVDLEIIRRLMGHENLSTTQRYVARTDEQKREAISRLDMPVESISQQASIPGSQPVPNGPGPLQILQTQRHHRTMSRLVRRWRNELHPPLWKYPLRDLGKPVIHQVEGDLSLNWQVHLEGKIDLCLPLEVAKDRETAIVRSNLWDHLTSSDLSWLVDDSHRGLPMWKETGGMELARRRDLLLAIDRTCQEITGQIPHHLVEETGPVFDFSNTVWANVIDGVYQDLSYQIEVDPESGFHITKYGAFTIARASTIKDAEKSVRWHQELRERWKSDSMVSEVHKLAQIRSDIAADIDDVLARLLLDSHIPGSCGTCS